MRFIPVIAALFMQAACASGSFDNLRDAQASSAVTYYDRNNDGVADLELHEPGHCDDCDWALADTDFNGRYDVIAALSGSGTVTNLASGTAATLVIGLLIE